MARLIAISNRTAADPNSRAGGLAVALWDALVESGGTWFGWSGEITDEPSRGLRVFQEDGVSFALTDLSRDEHDGFYFGYANRALWPIFHYRVDIAAFEEQEFDAYDAVNRRFARLIMPQVRSDDVLWVHDYHFLLLGEALRQEGWTGSLGFFLHIPFPAPELFRTLPEHGRLARALASFDLIGFQTEQDCANFRRYLVNEADGRLCDDGAVDVFETRVHARAFPIGIDAEEFAQLSKGDKAQEAARRIGRFLNKRDLIISVDRLDYSKGLPERFEAVGRLLQDYPDLRQKLQFTQIAPASRSKLEAYVDLRAQLNQLAGQINGDFGGLDWIPIRYLVQTFDRAELAGLYRMARVGLVTPLRDGMNLVAKEYVAAQDPENPGVLVLSEFAGAAEQLTEALIVNPHDVNAVANAIRMALLMPLQERKERWQSLNNSVSEYNIVAWRKSFLAALQDIRAAR